jgi:trimeric autotransporter adhesin
MKKSIILLAFVIASRVSLYAQVPQLVKDIYVGINQSNNDIQGIELGGNIILNANDGISGSELWFSNGSNAGTYMIKDINSGTSGSSPTNFFAFGSKILFVATDGWGAELWSTDGTLAGTSMVKDINAGGSSSTPSNFVQVGSKVLFLATTAANGRELWSTDGTNGGTVLAKDIWPGIANSNIVQIINSGLGYIYFVANDGVAGEELWKSDGTTAGTLLMKDVLPGTGYSNTTILKMAGNNLFFLADDGVVGKELWKSDGTTGGTALAKDIIPGGVGTFTSSVPECIAYNNKLFFITTDPANGKEIWESNGTPAGTIVNNISTGTVSTNFTSDMYIYNNELYFFRSTFAASNKDTVRFYKITSSVTNATEIKKFSGKYSTTQSKFNFIQTNNSKFVAVTECLMSSTSGNYFFVSDGTFSGSSMAVDSVFCTLGNSIPFIGNSWIYPVGPANDFELHNISHSTGNNTLVKNANPTKNFNNFTGPNNCSFACWNFQNVFFNNKYYYVADDGTTGVEFWSTDGTNGGTNLLTDIYPGSNTGVVGPNNGTFNYILTTNNMFFYANNGTTGRELWAIGSGPTSVNEMTEKIMENVFVYPNPASTELNFNLSSEFFDKDDTEFAIYNSVGQISTSGRLSSNKIDVSALAQGFYTLSLIKGNRTTVLKFIKN